MKYSEFVSDYFELTAAVSKTYPVGSLLLSERRDASCIRRQKSGRYHPLSAPAVPPAAQRRHGRW